MKRKKREGARRKGTPAELAPSVRVAIYTRKSVSDGLEQEFNSLDAQREAVEAFVASQRSEGWTALSERYDDGGFTGANTDRPAFQRLLADIEAGKVDVVAVYKIDRLSRSLADFARLVELFERQGVTFVSVTQQFSTTSSMGRLTLNILMSFAEFERQTISERTRDKIVASRRRGLWTGGRPVLGYDVVDKRLVVNPEEAEQVRSIFRCYLELGSLLDVVGELKRRGWKTKTWENKAGQLVQGRGFTKSSVHGLLKNPLYAGKMRCDEEIHEGVHEAIVDEETWQAVASRLRSNAGTSRANRGNGQEESGALLQGLARCGVCKSAMSYHYTQRGDRRYGYYVCSRQQKEGAKACPGSRVSVHDFEAFVVEQIRQVGRNPKLLAAALDADRADREGREPELVAEARRLRVERSRLEAERRNLVDAVAQGGSASGVLMARIEEMDGELARVVERAEDVHGELAAIELGQVDADDLGRELETLAPIWEELFPLERARVLALLLEQVEFNAANGEVAITFRPDGAYQVAGRGDSEVA